MRLVTGNKNYSSWSLRAWMLLDAFEIPFKEINVSLNKKSIAERLGKYSGTRKVPVLIDDQLVVWDSLAICEYVSDMYLDGKGWPESKKERAIARAICAEMHSDFVALREEMPMNCRAIRKVELSKAAKENISRIDFIWSAYAKKMENREVRLFGQFSIADCFYAPVVLRFKTYGIELSTEAQAYATSLLEHPSVKKWVSLANEETEVLEQGERGI